MQHPIIDFHSRTEFVSLVSDTLISGFYELSKATLPLKRHLLKTVKKKVTM